MAGRGLRRAAGPLTEWPCGRRRVHATFPTIDGDKSPRIASRSGEGNAGCGVRGNRDAPLRGPGSVILHDSPASAALSRSCRAGEEAPSLTQPRSPSPGRSGLVLISVAPVRLRAGAVDVRLRAFAQGPSGSASLL